MQKKLLQTKGNLRNQTNEAQEVEARHSVVEASCGLGSADSLSFYYAAL